EDSDHPAAHVLDAATGARLGMLDFGTALVGHAAFSRDGRLLAACANDGTVKLWRTDGLVPVATLASAPQPTQVAFVGADRLLVGNAGKQVEVWDVAARKIVRVLSGHA